MKTKSKLPRGYREANLFEYLLLGAAALIVIASAWLHL
jgi:hypothetical protein